MPATAAHAAVCMQQVVLNDNSCTFVVKLINVIRFFLSVTISVHLTLLWPPPQILRTLIAIINSEGVIPCHSSQFEGGPCADRPQSPDYEMSVDLWSDIIATELQFPQLSTDGVESGYKRMKQMGDGARTAKRALDTE